MKIVLLDRATLGADIDLSPFEELGEFVSYETTSKQERLDHIGDAEIILTNKVVIDKEILDAKEGIKLICITATGMDNVDLNTAKQKGIEVKNAAGYSTASVAQTTFTHALYLINQTRYYDDFAKEGEWSKSQIFTNVQKPFWQIEGKRWGIIGLGNIGRQVAKIASAFGAEVVYASASGTKREEAYKQVDLDSLLRTCSIVSIHAPLNEQTKGLIDKERIASMQKGAVLLNLGRGGIVDEEALAEAIDTQDIYAGVDVVGKEPIEASNPLLHVKRKERLLITPHIAWASRESREKLMQIVLENIKEFLIK